MQLIDSKVYAYQPLKLSASNMDYSTNRLSWNVVKGAASYDIYLKNPITSKYRKVGTTSKCSVKDKQLQPNTEYQYIVAAKNNDNKIIAVSNIERVITPNYFGKMPDPALFLKYSEEYPHLVGHDGFLFFIGGYYSDTNYPDGIYKVSMDDLKVRKIISKDSIWSLNLVNNRLYYAKHTAEPYHDEIISADLNGNDKKVVLDTEKLSEAIRKIRLEYSDFYPLQIYDFIVVDDVFYLLLDIGLPFDDNESFYGLVTCTENNYTDVKFYDIYDLPSVNRSPSEFPSLPQLYSLDQDEIAFISDGDGLQLYTFNCNSDSCSSGKYSAVVSELSLKSGYSSFLSSDGKAYIHDFIADKDFVVKKVNSLYPHLHGDELYILKDKKIYKFFNAKLKYVATLPEVVSEDDVSIQIICYADSRYLVCFTSNNIESYYRYDVYDILTKQWNLMYYEQEKTE